MRWAFAMSSFLLLWKNVRNPTISRNIMTLAAIIPATAVELRPDSEDVSDWGWIVIVGVGDKVDDDVVVVVVDTRVVVVVVVVDVDDDVVVVVVVLVVFGISPVSILR